MLLPGAEPGSARGLSGPEACGVFFHVPCSSGDLEAKIRAVSPLPKRARSVLYAVVTEFIETGEPVGSRTLTKKYGFSLSPATIRNVLADLEDAGYLLQPHTSAGRLPTHAAFRLFVDALMRVRSLPDGDATRINEWLED